MDSYIVWFVVAFGLLVAELLTGTFYLLVIAIALAAAGFAALAGAPSALQFIVAAAIGLGGSIWLRSTRFGKRLHERGEDLISPGDRRQGGRETGRLGDIDLLLLLLLVPLSPCLLVLPSPHSLSALTTFFQL